MYLTEISPVNFRGAMGVLHQFALTCGILVSQIIGMRQLLGGYTDIIFKPFTPTRREQFSPTLSLFQNGGLKIVVTDFL